MSERGKIMPRRLTGNSKNHQEMVEKAIKRARHMALVPYIVDTKNVTDAAFYRQKLIINKKAGIYFQPFFMPKI